jgi:hypothetical protein
MTAMMKTSRRLAIAIAFAALAALYSAAADAACKGIWAVGATSLSGDGAGPARAQAPDRRARLEGVPGEDKLRFVGASGVAEPLQVYADQGRELVEPSQGLTEMLWAPDSRHVAVNASSGGVVGTWNLTVFEVRQRRPKRLPPYRALQAAANRLPRCETPEIANLGVAAWLKGGAEMLVVAQAPPHSSCRNMGALHGYRVATASGRILESLPYAALRKRWPRELGCNAQPMQ